jgi:hypothetical protein
MIASQSAHGEAGAPRWLPAHLRDDQHDPFLCSLVDELHGDYWACSACVARHRAQLDEAPGAGADVQWPHHGEPNTQGTGRRHSLAQQLAEALHEHPDLLRPVLLQLLTDAITDIVLAVQAEGSHARTRT